MDLFVTLEEVYNGNFVEVRDLYFLTKENIEFY